MARLVQTRKTFSVALVVLSAVALLSAAYLLLPLGPSQSSRQREYNHLRELLQAKRDETQPLLGMDQKLARARADIGRFYRQRLPASQSAVAEELGKLAGANGIGISGVRYDSDATALPELRLQKIEADLHGDYLHLARFINSLERDQIFFIINGISLGEQQAGNVRLALSMETYLRSQRP